MEVCCMANCRNTTENTNLSFFPFPTDFHLCMVWVQNCGRSDLLDDFAYGGALPFVDRRVCSQHFRSSDFKNWNKTKGLSAKVVPIATDLKLTVTPDTHDGIDEHDADRGLTMSPNNISNYGTVESLADRVCWDLLVKSHEDKVKRKQTIRFRKAHRKTNTSDNQRKRKNQQRAKRAAARRAQETEQERRDRLYKTAVRAAVRRNVEPADVHKERKLKNALRAACRRAMETPEQRELRRVKDQKRSANRRAKESEVQRRIRKYNDAVRAAERRSNETEEEKTQRKMIDLVRAARRRSLETPEHRENRLQADRDRAARRRLVKKKFSGLEKTYESSEFEVSTDSGYSMDSNIDVGFIKQETLKCILSEPQDNHENDEVDIIVPTETVWCT